MGHKTKKQFGVWMDSNKATVVGRESADGDFTILGQIKSEYSGSNSSEHTANNLQKTQQTKLFKDITAFTPNADEIHIVGTGIAQEQFKHYLADTPQFKNTNATDGTALSMNDEQLVDYFKDVFK